MHNPVLLKQNPQGSVAKMGALVTNNSSRNSKPAKYVRPNKIHNNSSIISSSGFGFHPFWNIINNKQDVSETKRDRERAHEIYTQTSNTSQNSMGCWGICCLQEMVSLARWHSSHVLQILHASNTLRAVLCVPRWPPGVDEWQNLRTQSMREFYVKTETSSGNTHINKFICHL